MEDEATDIVEHLAQQTQLLASLKTLATLHIFASIPLERPACVQDIADVFGLSSKHLSRIIRFVASRGFLSEPQPGLVQHTSLSAQLLKKPAYLDAVKFLGDSALPTALQTAYHLTTSSKEPFGVKHEHDQKRLRQAAAYQRLRRELVERNVTRILSTLQWSNLGSATVVQVGPPSAATAVSLASQYKSLQFVVQLCKDKTAPGRRDSKQKEMVATEDLETTMYGPRISVTYRSPGQPQGVRDAHTYILYLPEHSLSYATNDVASDICAELRIHLDMLRANPHAKLILVTEILPDPGTTEYAVETAARSQDLFLMQTKNEGLFDIAQIRGFVASTRDMRGGLSIVNHVVSKEGPTLVAQIAVIDG